MPKPSKSNTVTNSESGVSAVVDEVMIVVTLGTSGSVINQVETGAGEAEAGERSGFSMQVSCF